jgi:hypothetical protein
MSGRRSEMGRRLLIEAVDERMLIRAMVAVKRFGGLYQDFVCIGGEDGHRLRDD